jgi:hypothetical protein
MAINFPNTPTDGQVFIDPNGASWTYNTATNSWTAEGASSQIVDATETDKGIVQLATAAEVTTGTNTTKAVTPAGLKVELDKKVNLAGDTMTGNLTVPSLNGGQLAGFRNVLINGDFTVWQRGVAFPAVNGYTADRWFAGGAGTLCSVGKGGHPSGLGEQVALNATGVAGNTRTYFAQKVESCNSAALALKEVTFSVYVFSSVARSIRLAIDHADAADNFSAITNIGSKAFTLAAGTFTQCIYTVTLPAAAARGIQVVIAAESGVTSGTFAISMAQLEPGPVATPFERRNYNQEYAFCQRYFSGAIPAYLIGNIQASGQLGLVVSLPQRMRATPTYVETTNSSVSLGATTYLASGNPQYVYVYASGTSIANATLSTSFAASAEL